MPRYPEGAMLRVLTLSTLYPDATRPNFGVFVERQTHGLASLPDTQVTVVAPVGLPPGPLARIRHSALAKLPARETWNGLDVHRPRFLNLPFTGGRWSAPMLARSLAPVLDRLEFDVIDASFFFPDGVAAAALGRRYGVPVSIKARGADIHHWGRARATRAQVLAAGGAADGLLAVSESMRADMAALGMSATRIRVHRTGVDQDRFTIGDRTAAKAAFGVKGPLVVATGALVQRKSHDIVIRAMATLPGVSLLIAGDGPERTRLEAYIRQLGAGDRIRLLGSVPHAELPRLLAAADVMALASASEGLANAWVEALACGVPIVTTDVGGAREVVTDPSAGCIVPRDPAALADAVAALLRDAPDPRTVRAHAAPFTWKANALALREHLAGLVQSSG